MERVTLTYKRLPDRVDRFQQDLLHIDDSVIVTTQRVRPSAAIVQKDKTVLDANFAVVWFIFTGAWFDVGRVYNLENAWTGYYCDIIKPVVRDVDTSGRLVCFEITDLFLDLWVNPDGSYAVQDADEFSVAVRGGAIDAGLAKQAEAALQELIAEVEAGDFTPRVEAVMNRAGFPDIQAYLEQLP